MKNNNLSNSFLENGYCILKNSIESKTISQIKKSILGSLKKIVEKKSNDIDLLFKYASKKYHQEDVQIFIHHELQLAGLKEMALKNEKIFNFTKKLLGPDLAYNEEGSIRGNFQKTNDNLYQKKLHQEMWSGAGLNELRIWFPITGGKNYSGLNIIPKSHLWGFIENRDREPYNIPEDIELRKKTLRLDIGDALFFHGLTLHETEPHNQNKTRFALTVGIRNFNHSFSGHQRLQNWRIYNYSTLSKIQKKLGNPMLSQYRTLNSTLSHKNKTKKGLKLYFR